MITAGRAPAAQTLAAALVFASLSFMCPAAVAQATQSAPAPPSGDAPGTPATQAIEPLDPSPGSPAPSAQPSEPEGQQPADGGAETAMPDASEPAEQPDATAAPAPATAQEVAPADPVIAAVREKLAAGSGGGKASPADRDGASAFYRERSEGPLWVKVGGGFTTAAEAAIREIRKADDWGLSASAFDLPQAGSDTSPQGLADTEVAMAMAVLQYARHARGGRIDPLALSPALDMRPPLKAPKTVLQEIAKADSADAYLRGLHPKHEQFVRLRKALAELQGPKEQPAEDEAISVKLPPGKNIRPGAQHPDVSLLRRRLKVPAEAGNETIYDEPLQEAVMAFQRANGLKANGLISKATRTALNGETAAKPNPERDIQRVINNMERWRWMPENLGAFHVWNNIPEFLTRSFKDGKKVYEERIVVGLPQWATPSFSARMRTLVFHPEWGVPDGIKQKELSPQLRRASGGGNDFFESLFGGGGGGSRSAVLRRHDLKVSYNGRPVDPDSVDWNSVDIRRFQFTQPAGPRNVLGVVKFLFPNKHDVYMHDTTAKDLFKRSMRAYSHGCMRLANPVRFAELLLQEDKGWSAEQVQDRLAMGALNEVKLDRPIWVHNTYFTAVVDDNGKLNTFADVYGFEPRVAAALSGKSIRFETPPQIAEVEPDGSSVPGQQPRRRKQRVTQSDPLTEAITGLFAN